MLYLANLNLSPLTEILPSEPEICTFAPKLEFI